MIHRNGIAAKALTATLSFAMTWALVPSAALAEILPEEELAKETAPATELLSTEGEGPSEELVSEEVLPQEEGDANEEDGLPSNPPITFYEESEPQSKAGLTPQASIIQTGTWGTCPWELDSEGTLRVKAGRGEEPPYGTSPWKAWQSQIKNVVFYSGVELPWSIDYLFYNLSNVESIDVSSWDTSTVHTMREVFQGCTRLETLDVSKWDTSNVTDMEYLFSGCTRLETLDVSKWDTSNVTDMSHLFEDCYYLRNLDVSNWKTSKVTYMSNLFYGCEHLASYLPDVKLDVSSWNVRNVKSFDGMFDFNMGGSSSMSGFNYYDGTPLLDLSSWNTSSATNMSGMFGYQSVATIIVGRNFTVPTGQSPFKTYSSAKFKYWSEKANQWLDTQDIWPTRNGVADIYTYYCPRDAFKDLVEVTFPQTKYTYTGNAIQPKPVVKIGGETLTEATDSSYNGDYTLNWNDEYTEGAYTVPGVWSISIEGSYSGQYEGCGKTVYLEIVPASISDATVALSQNNFTYTGSEIKPGVSVKLGDRTLVAGQDYDVSYANNINVGTNATVTVTGKGNYQGSVSSQFTITQATIDRITLSQDSFIYDGTEKKPTVTAYAGTAKVPEGNYHVSYFNNIEVGTSARVMVIANNNSNYTGIVEKFFSITAPADISGENFSASVSGNFTFDGTAKAPKPVVKEGTKTLVEGTDYTLTYQSNTNAGTAKVVVTGKGSYSGQRTVDFTITPATITTLSLSQSSFSFDGRAKQPSLTVKAGELTVPETDYEASFANNITVGTAHVVVEGKGNFEGTKSASFQITAGTISSLSVVPDQLVYDGSAKEPQVLAYSGEALLPAADYEVFYVNNVQAGDASVIVTGKGNLEGAGKTAKFKILAAGITSVEVVGAPFIFDGREKKPELVVRAGELTVPASDYDVEYANNVALGTASVTVSGKNNFTGSASTNFEIVEEGSENPGEISSVVVSPTSFTYDGKAKEPSVTVKAQDKTLSASEYDLRYENNINAGAAQVLISGKGSYAGQTKSASFQILPAQITSVSVPDGTYIADGNEHKPAVTVLAGNLTVPATDYDVTYSNNINAGTATVSVSGKNNFTGTQQTSFEIVAGSVDPQNPMQITEVSVDTSDLVYNGQAKTPALIVKAGNAIVPETGYTVEYLNNVSAGTAWALVEGMGNYQGTKNVSFTIEQATITSVSLSPTNFTYDGKEKKPALTVYAGNLEVPAEGYEASYSNNIEVGTASVTVTGKGNFKGSATASFTITNSGGGSGTDDPKPSAEPCFTDVPTSHTFHRVIHEVKDLGLIEGIDIPGSTVKRYNPEGKITRAQIAVILWRMNGKPNVGGTSPFPDVKEGSYYYKAVLWAYKMGVVSGFKDDTFRPNNNITREQLGLMLASYAQRVAKKPVKGSQADYKHLKDAAKVTNEAPIKMKIGWCVANGLLSGTQSGYLQPKNTATRAAAAKMVLGLYKYVK